MTRIDVNNTTANFWQTLEKPIIGLSPMDGVTDFSFRFIQKKYGNPAVVYTEFSSVEGITHGSTAFLKEFLYDPNQGPVVAQIFGTDPTAFYEATIMICELGFDGVDINMGCPAKNVAHRGAGAGLIKTPKLAQQIIKSVQQATQDWANGMTLKKGAPSLKKVIRDEVARRHEALPALRQLRRLLPVSVKTRKGYDHDQVDEWIPTLLATKPAAIALHGRTLTQHYGGAADWEAIGRAATLAHNTNTLLLGNGDVQSIEDATTKIANYGVDGILIGRATFGNPFIFTGNTNPNAEQLAPIAIEHAQHFEKHFSPLEKYNFLPMRKHLGWYIRGVENAVQIRTELFQTHSAQEVTKILAHHNLV